MSEPSAEELNERYKCSYECGRTFDIIIVDTREGTSEQLCLPDFLKLANDISQAILVDVADDAAEKLQPTVADLDDDMDDYDESIPYTLSEQ
jgi:hypothetical protein